MYFFAEDISLLFLHVFFMNHVNRSKRKRRKTNYVVPYIYKPVNKELASYEIIDTIEIIIETEYEFITIDVKSEVTSDHMKKSNVC